MEKKIVFVYNANSDFFSTAKDFLHKIVSPQTYQCNLCAVTYGHRSMKSEWKQYIESLPYQVEFLHKDELQKEYNIKNPKLPAAYIKENGKLRVFITKKEISQSKTLQELINLVKRKIKSSH